MEPMEEVYRQYANTVYGYLLSLTRNPDVAEELTQETFFQAIRTSDRFDGSSKVSTWLCAIAKRAYLTYSRKHPKLAQIDEESVGAESSAELAAIRNEERLELLKKLHALDEPYREVLYLRLFGGLPFRDIGAVHGRTENWARVTFYRGKEKLRKELNEDERDPV